MRKQTALYKALQRAQQEFTGLDFKPTLEAGVYTSTYIARGCEWVLQSRMWRRRLHVSMHQTDDVEMKLLWSVSIDKNLQQGHYTYYNGKGEPVECHRDLHVMLVRALTEALSEMNFEYEMQHMF